MGGETGGDRRRQEETGGDRSRRRRRRGKGWLGALRGAVRHAYMHMHARLLWHRGAPLSSGRCVACGDVGKGEDTPAT